MRKIMNATHKTTDDQRQGALDTIRLGAIAGAAGGLAEIAWVSLYAATTGANPAVIARGVTTAAGASALFPADAVTLGVGFHMVIAVALGIAMTSVWRVMPSAQANPFSFAIVVLAGVWALNFFVVLPIVSPAFLTLLPYSVSLVSKLAFGMAAAGALQLFAVPAGALHAARIRL